MIELPTSVPPLQDRALRPHPQRRPCHRSQAWPLHATWTWPIAGGRIAAVEKDIYPLHAQRVLDVSPYYVTPGLIDMHVHLDHQFLRGRSRGRCT